MSKTVARTRAGARPGISQKRKAQAIFLGALLLFAAMIGIIRYLKSQQEAERASAPPKMTSYVMDEAHLIDSGVRAQLNERLRALYRADGPQVVVATIAGVTKGSIAEDAIAHARAWRIGHAGRNDGVLLLIAANERKARIEVGYGLEGVLTDAVSRLIIQNRMERHLQAREWTQAAAGGVDGVLDVVGKIVVAPNAGRVPESQDSLLWTVVVFAGKGLLVVVFVSVMALFFIVLAMVALSILQTILLAIPGVGPRIKASPRWSWLARPLPVRPGGGSSSSDSGSDWSSSSSSSSSSGDSGGGGDFGGGGSND
ncbi:MAG: TPM domain-containing protein [Rhodoblastus sp.]|nr:TPM domain-containing protein [Rhodoblastus sp.]